MYAFSNTSCDVGVKALHVKSSGFDWSVTNDALLSRDGEGCGLLDDDRGRVYDWPACFSVETRSWLVLFGVETWLTLLVLGGVVTTF